MLKIRLSIICLVVVFFASCNVLKQMKTFAKCDFKFKNVTNVRLAGVEVQNKKSLKDFNLIDAANLLKSVANNQFMLDLVVNMEVTNPNPATAALDGGEWILFIDNTEMMRGNLTQRVEIAANNGRALMPLNVQIDLKKIFTKETKDTIINFGLNLACNEGEPTRVSLWIKPKVSVAGVLINYPDYIKLGKQF